MVYGLRRHQCGNGIHRGYWIPAYEIFEQHGFHVVLVNARYAKNVPGRKTDVGDASWLQQLHAYGLLRGSFRPDREIAKLRPYLRQRERLVEYAAADIQHMQKALMEMNCNSTTWCWTSPA